MGKLKYFINFEIGFFFFLIHQIMCSVIFLVCFSSIYQRSNQQLVLTVTTPPLANDPFTLDYSPEQGFEGAAVIVAHRKGCANGNASQLWRYDPITGFIEAFSADTTNRGTVNLIWSNGQQLYLNEANCITTLESHRRRDGRYQLVDSFNFGAVSRQGINSSRPRANFPWKIVKENMRNNRFHAKYEKKVLFFSCQNLSTETRGRGKEKSKLSYTKRILRWFTILFRVLPKRYGFQTLRRTRLCGNLVCQPESTPASTTFACLTTVLLGSMIWQTGVVLDSLNT